MIKVIKISPGRFHGLAFCRLASLLAVASLAFASPAFAADGAKMLDAVLRAPGDYSQVCDVLSKPMPVALPIWRPRLGSAGYGLSTKKRAMLQANRAVLVPALQKRLASLDFSRAPKPQPVDKKPDRTDMPEVVSGGADPMAFSDLMLDVILEIKAVETLPQLLNVEAKLHDALILAEKSPAALIPQMEGFTGIQPQASAAEQKDTRNYDELPAAERAARERRGEICAAQAGHRSLLAVIGNLVRAARYQPLLDSKLEKSYQIMLRRKVAESDKLKGIKSAADIAAHDRSSIWIDPVTRLPVDYWSSLDVPYTEEVRLTIRRMAEGYLSGPRG